MKCFVYFCSELINIAGVLFLRLKSNRNNMQTRDFLRIAVALLLTVVPITSRAVVEQQLRTAAAKQVNIDRGTDKQGKIVETRTKVMGSKGRLATIIQRPAGAKGRVPVTIFMHGFGGSKDGEFMSTIADSILSRGIAVVRFDFNGHGESEGKFEEMTVPNEIEDAKCIYKYVRQQPWTDTTRISLAGHSQGGVVAAMTAGELGDILVAAVVLMAPAAVLRDDAIRGNTFGVMYDPLNPPAVIEIAGGRLRLGADYVRTAFRLPIYETAANYHGPACIIHGTGDRIVPYTYGLRFHQLWKGSEYDELPGFDHGFSQDIHRLANLTAEFLGNKIGRP